MAYLASPPCRATPHLSTSLQSFSEGSEGRGKGLIRENYQGIFYLNHHRVFRWNVINLLSESLTFQSRTFASWDLLNIHRSILIKSPFANGIPLSKYSLWWELHDEIDKDLLSETIHSKQCCLMNTYVTLWCPYTYATSAAYRWARTWHSPILLLQVIICILNVWQDLSIWVPT